MQKRHVLAVMVLCLLVGAILRLPNLRRFPPGLHYDEAANAILSAEIGLEGERPLFIPSYTGKEPLFFYAAGGVMALVGKSIFSLRLTAALLGLLTIAGTFSAGTALTHDKRIGLMAAAIMAVSFWHVLFSRLGFRAVTQPLLQALTIAALWWGLRDTRPQSWRKFGVAGIFLGLTAYTYLAARLFPLLLLIALATLLWHSHNRKHRLQQLSITGLIALLVVAPLLVYFYQHPDAFWTRIDQVGANAGISALFVSYIKSLRMFFMEGDPYSRFNIPLRPLFSPIMGGALLVGFLGFLHTRWLPKQNDWQRAASALIIWSPFIMILPTALALNEIVPSNLRAIGLMPFVFYLPAITLVYLIQWLSTTIRPQSPTYHWQSTGVVLLLAVGLPTTIHTYFQKWGTRTDLFYESDGDLVSLAEYLNNQEWGNDPLFVSALHYRHPTLAFLSQNYDQIKWLSKDGMVVLPANVDNAHYFYTHNAPVPYWAYDYLNSPSPQPYQDEPPPPTLFAEYETLQNFISTEGLPPLANFGHAITLYGVEFHEVVGGELRMLLFWQVNSIPAMEVTPFIHLTDQHGYRWSQMEPLGYPVEQWAVGDIILQQVNMPLPLGLPPYPYQMEIGLFDRATGDRLPNFNYSGQFAGTTYTTQSITLSRPQLVEDVQDTGTFLAIYHLARKTPLGQTSADQLRLWGTDYSFRSVETGDHLAFTLYWETNQSLPPDWRLLFQWQQIDGDYQFTNMSDPVYDSYPFAQWTTGFVVDRHWLEVPADFPVGAYYLHVKVINDREETVLSQLIGTVNIVSTERSFTVPAFSHPVNATFGNEITLLGYNLDENNTLTLIWQALTEPTTDYTVFVHLLDEEGACCVWQQDVMPKQNTYGTSRWLPNEVVTDVYQLPATEGLNAGSYPIEIGLYLADSGTRLQVIQEGKTRGDALFLDPLMIETNN